MSPIVASFKFYQCIPQAKLHNSVRNRRAHIAICYVQNYLGCYSKLNLCSKFYAVVATYLPHIILKKNYVS